VVALLAERSGDGYRSGMSDNQPPREDQAQTKRDIRAALIFGVVAATLEMAVLLYFLFW
jgi:hypothetical protein